MTGEGEGPDDCRELTDEDAISTFHTISALLVELLREGNVQRTARVEELLVDVHMMVAYALKNRTPLMH